MGFVTMFHDFPGRILHNEDLCPEGPDKPDDCNYHVMAKQWTHVVSCGLVLFAMFVSDNVAQSLDLGFQLYWYYWRVDILALMVAYVLFTAVLLLSLLIAILGNTYNRIRHVPSSTPLNTEFNSVFRQRLS